MTQKFIQYVERFDSLADANSALNGLKILTGFLSGRAILSPSFGEKDFLCQAFFEFEQDVNADSISSCYGLRMVQAPLKMVIDLCK